MNARSKFSDLELKELMYDDYSDMILGRERYYQAMPFTVARSVARGVLTLALIGLVLLLFPKLLPIPFGTGWMVRGSIVDWIRSSWIWFAWGIGGTALISHFFVRSPPFNRYVEFTYRRGLLCSLCASVSEELLFRWLIFLAAIIGVQLVNACTFGVVHWLYTNIYAPFVDFVCLRKLHAILFHPLGWSIGAGMLVSNFLFQRGHSYQGIAGQILVWFAGMFLFWIVFRYGLLAAAFIHALYNWLIDTTEYIGAVLQRKTQRMQHA